MKKNKYYKSIIYSLIAGVFMMAGAPAVAGLEKIALRNDIPATEKPLELKYDIYAGGFKALDASLQMDVDSKAYDMTLAAKTQGFIAKLFPWQATYVTSGHTDDAGQPLPLQHTARSAWKKNEKVTEMDYNPKGDLLKTTTQENNKTNVKRDIDPKLTTNTVDMLTGTLLMLQNSESAQKCKGEFPVFDGKRRFNITLQDDGTEVLHKSKYSSYDGTALRCTLKVQPVAGFKDKDKNRGWMAVQNHTEARKKPPTIWLGQLKENGPMVPVRMEIASDYGSVVAHLTASNK